MTATDLLAALRAAGGDLELEDGRLVLVEADPLSDHLVDALRAARDDLTTLLKSQTTRHLLDDDQAAIVVASSPSPPDPAELERRRFGTDLASRRQRAQAVDAAIASERHAAGLVGWLERRW